MHCLHRSEFMVDIATSILSLYKYSLPAGEFFLQAVQELIDFIGGITGVVTFAAHSWFSGSDHVNPSLVDCVIPMTGDADRSLGQFPDTLVFGSRKSGCFEYVTSGAGFIEIGNVFVVRTMIVMASGA